MTLANANELSTHLAFVQRLTRGLLGADGVDGDDVAQEAIVRAWRKAPDDCRDLRGWLTTVIDHLAHDQRRSAARRRTHEQRAAPLASVPAVHTAWCSAMVDADGRFAVEDVGPEQDLQFAVRCPGFGARTVAPGVALSPGDESLPLFPFAHRHTRTAADGAFRFAGLAAGHYDLSIVGVGKQWSVEQDVADLQYGEVRSGLRIVVDSARTLSVRVRVPGGAQLPLDCRMALVAQHDGESLHWAEVAADGSFVFEQLPGSSYRISALDVPAGLAMAAAVEVQTGPGELTIDLVNAERVEGRVVDAQDRSLRGVAVTFWPAGAAVARPCVTDASGTFCIEAAPGVSGRLQASDPDDPFRSVSRSDVRTGDRGIVLRMP